VLYAPEVDDLPSFVPSFEGQQRAAGYRPRDGADGAKGSAGCATADGLGMRTSICPVLHLNVLYSVSPAKNRQDNRNTTNATTVLASKANTLDYTMRNQVLV
jgi:hypothetical protein